VSAGKQGRLQLWVACGIKVRNALNLVELHDGTQKEPVDLTRRQSRYREAIFLLAQ
jgi:hypothetical protein